MLGHSPLIGSVRPYFGRSDRPRPVSMKRESRDSAYPSVRHPVRTQVSSSPPEAARDVVVAAAEELGCMIHEDESGFDLVVDVDDRRVQSIHVECDVPHSAGQMLVVYSTRCGPAKSRNALALLRRNTNMHQMAFAVQRIENEELFTLRGFHAADTVTPSIVAEMLTTMARTADRIESKLLGTDEY
jgi:hypothetical protein